MSNRLLLSWVAVVVSFGGAAASGQPFSNMVIFGDSLSDTGNIYTASENPLIAAVIASQRPEQPLPYPPEPYFDKRFSNGPVWVDHLAQSLGLPTPVSDLKNPSGIGLPVAGSGGYNYAVGGAETSGNDPTGLADLDDQVDRYLGERSPAHDELFVLLGGANNILNQEAGVDVNVIVSDLTGFITELYNAGGRHFLVSNLPALGQSPGNLGSSNSALLDQLAGDFNTAYDSALDTLEANLDGVQLYRVDFHAVLDDMLNHPDLYSLQNVTEAAIDKDSLEYHPDFKDDFLFWDDLHPAAQFHKELGDAAVAALPEPASALFFLAGGAAVLLRRR